MPEEPRGLFWREVEALSSAFPVHVAAPAVVLLGDAPVRATELDLIGPRGASYFVTGTAPDGTSFDLPHRSIPQERYDRLWFDVDQYGMWTMSLTVDNESAGTTFEVVNVSLEELAGSGVVVRPDWMPTAHVRWLVWSRGETTRPLAGSPLAG